MARRGYVERTHRCGCRYGHNELLGTVPTPERAAAVDCPRCQREQRAAQRAAAKAAQAAVELEQARALQAAGLTPMQARYRGRCAACGGPIQPGDAIAYDRSERLAYHRDCGLTRAETPVEPEQPAPVVAEPVAEPPAPAPYRLRQGEGYGGRPWTVGEVVRVPSGRDGRPFPAYADYPEYLVVERAGATYYREDGMSFGVGDEAGHVYWAECRAATPAEAAPLVAAAQAAAARQAARTRLAALLRELEARAERPARESIPAGETLLAQTTANGTYLPLYGGGWWLVVAPDGIWSIHGHGADGDDWSRNNLPGAIGYRVPRDAALEDELRALCTTLGGEG